jgi:acetyltransferase-like isoleucine patch superfamily enzyme
MSYHVDIADSEIWSPIHLFDALRRWLVRQIQVKVWRMDIHPSARIAPTALIDRTWPRGIHIAEGCVVDEEVVVLAHDMSRGIYVDTYIGARCRLGARSIVMPGVTIGEDSVIAPGAVVIRDVPPRSYAVGNPAVVQERDTVTTGPQTKAVPSGPKHN